MIQYATLPTFNGKWAPMRSPSYWLFDHEVADFESSPLILLLPEMTYNGGTHTIRCGNRHFYVKVNPDGTGSMWPYSE